jgi:hypothetical protein
MKQLIYLALLFSVLGADTAYKGHIGVEGEYFSHDMPNKRDDAFALRGEFEGKTALENGEFKLKAKVIYDKDDHNRRYLEFEELYYRHDFEEWELLAGRNVLFWGALEVYNLVDVFNTKDTLDDPFDYDKKLGVWNISITRFFENFEVSLLVRLKEEDQKFQESESVYNFLPLDYDSHLKKEYHNRPSVFVKYSGSGEEVQVDYGVMFEAGYDDLRYFSYDLKRAKLYQNAYWVNKLMGYTTYVKGDTIYKAEGAYAISDDVKVSDYLYVGAGVEYTLYGLWEKKDLGLLAEYYGYDRLNDTKLTSEALGVLFQNDLYVGFRLSFNDVASSEILAGVDMDLDNHEKLYLLKYDTRLWEHYKVELQYQHLSPANGSFFEKLDHVKLFAAYYF